MQGDHTEEEEVKMSKVLLDHVYLEDLVDQLLFTAQILVVEVAHPNSLADSLRILKEFTDMTVTKKNKLKRLRRNFVSI